MIPSFRVLAIALVATFALSGASLVPSFDERPEDLPRRLRNGEDVDRFWPQWRGPGADGVAPHSNPPVEWSEDHNVAWKITVPGRGSASPIIWGDQIFVLTAVPVAARNSSPAPGAARQRRQQLRRGFGHLSSAPSGPLQFIVLAINRVDGATLWSRAAHQGTPHEGKHPTGTFASASAITDGERLYAFFGSKGLYCYDLDGNLQWFKDLGDMTIRLGFGEGSSPALHDDTLVVNWDHEGQSFIVALDAVTGEERWRTNRDEITSWATPLIVEHGGRRQVVTSATSKVRSYDLETGGLLWEDEGLTLNAIPSPVTDDGVVYVTSGFRGSALRAIRLTDASGTITGSNAVLWRHDRDTPYVPSPLLYSGQLFVLKSNSGILTSFDAKSGKKFYGPERLPSLGDIYASPVGAGDRVYIVDREGKAVVLKRGDDLQVLAQNQLDDGFDASPAIVGDEIYLRGRTFLYRISSETRP